MRKTEQPESTQRITYLDSPDVKTIGVEVANGNGVSRLAKRVGGYLQHQGYPAARLTNQKPYTVKVSQIQYRQGFDEAARQLQSSLPGNPEIVQSSDLRKDINLRLVVGKDWAGSKGGLS